MFSRSPAILMLVTSHIQPCAITRSAGQVSITYQPCLIPGHVYSYGHMPDICRSRPINNFVHSHAQPVTGSAYFRACIIIWRKTALNQNWQLT